MMPLNLVAVVALISALVGSVGSWTVTAAVKNAEIARIEKKQADDKATQTQAALDDLAAAAKRISEQAEGAKVDISALDARLTEIRKDLKNAKKNPLPVDCKPDALRMLSLGSAVEAANQAVARPKPSGTVQGADKAGKP